MASVKFACVVVMFMVVVGSHSAVGMTCGQVQGNLAQCIGFLQKGGFVPPACCSGVKNILNSSRTTPDRRAVCSCLKAAAGAVRGINPNNAEALPGKCGVNLPYKISASTNCNRYIYYFEVSS
ncbi:hypothetical protein LR48_Vigan11g078600 [Vigna angularis]|uniref:Non-specific lipid-transfer protein n=1 Tax=Phaseolus angularis TaxID=3914 RepID=A0A0L9VS25_PHAAN|nr:hypothetical protein LR48_Vigan11g078600 [Vigna angularis]